MKHTWKIRKTHIDGSVTVEASDNGIRSIIVKINDKWIAPEHGETDKIARLIAAAPDLLDMCKATKNYLIKKADKGGWEAALLGKIIAAIAKAEGEKP